MARTGFIILLLVFTVHSCIYTDNSSYFEEIEPDYNPTVRITSNFDTIDSITIVDSLLFRYEISIDTGTLYFADLFLENQQLFRSDTLVDSLWFYPEYIYDGETYDITLRAYYRSYTGSLADAFNAEFLLTDSVWTVQFFTD